MLPIPISAAINETIAMAKALSASDLKDDAAKL